LDPDQLQEGVEKFIDEERVNIVYDFIARYVRKLYADGTIRNNLEKSPGLCFLQFITPSDIAYIITLIKNGKTVWDQELMKKSRGSTEIKKKTRPLFTCGEGQKRLLGQSVWSDDGMEYYETARNNWIEVYKDEALFGDFCMGWEQWLLTETKEYKGEEGWSRKSLYDVLGTWKEDGKEDELRNKKAGGQKGRNGHSKKRGQWNEEESEDEVDNYEYYEDEELPVRKVGGYRIGVTGDGGRKLAATDVHMESGMENNGSNEGDGERDDTKLIDDFTTDQNTDKEDRGMNSGAKDDERSEEVAVDAVVKTMGKQISATKVNTRNKGKRNIKK
jgi:hypothetical protein